MKIDLATFWDKDAIKNLNREAFPETEKKNLQLISHWVFSVIKSFLSLAKKAVVLLALLLSMDRPIGAGVESYFEW